MKKFVIDKESMSTLFVMKPGTYHEKFKEELNVCTSYTRNPLMQGFTEDYFVLNDGVKIRYLHKGSGMPLIFVPAFGCMADTYALNAPAFTDDFSVYVLEMRGHGFSDAPAHGAHAECPP
ncbi:alpha/beta hydrolase [Priestia megaterium]|uniref:Alpha/beta hydrolase n=1 Tax=Priestia megaterium TaxID=1404 RepID=A0A6H1P5D4_PRIMG|nr:alpha/beta hydrolase [Priestia megaterium]QIZ08627.1 alpha/beta hydrolase [Priestia megaterium]